MKKITLYHTVFLCHRTLTGMAMLNLKQDHKQTRRIEVERTNRCPMQKTVHVFASLSRVVPRVVLG